MITKHDGLGLVGGGVRAPASHYRVVLTTANKLKMGMGVLGVLCVRGCGWVCRIGWGCWVNGDVLGCWACWAYWAFHQRCYETPPSGRPVGSALPGSNCVAPSIVCTIFCNVWLCDGAQGEERSMAIPGVHHLEEQQLSMRLRQQRRPLLQPFKWRTLVISRIGDRCPPSDQIWAVLG